MLAILHKSFVVINAIDLLGIQIHSRIRVSMRKVVGADWAGKGWFTAARTGEDTVHCDLFPSITSLWRHHRDAALILLTIPIGLPSGDDHRRRCDERAKRLLGPRHHGVFYAPIRPAVYEHNLPAAKALNAEAGFGIQNQTWSLVPRMREVDEFLDAHPGARDRCRETHPEVCFRALNGGPLDNPPTGTPGLEERFALLTSVESSFEEPITAAVDTFTYPRFAPLVRDRGHIYAAFVAALTASRPPESRSTLPESPPTDSRGLPMEIVYPTDMHQLTLEDLE